MLVLRSAFPVLNALGGPPDPDPPLFAIFCSTTPLLNGCKCLTSSVCGFALWHKSVHVDRFTVSHSSYNDSHCRRDTFTPHGPVSNGDPTVCRCLKFFYPYRSVRCFSCFLFSVTFSGCVFRCVLHTKLPPAWILLVPWLRLSMALYRPGIGVVFFRLVLFEPLHVIVWVAGLFWSSSLSPAFCCMLYLCYRSRWLRPKWRLAFPSVLRPTFFATAFPFCHHLFPLPLYDRFPLRCIRLSRLRSVRESFLHFRCVPRACRGALPSVLPMAPTRVFFRHVLPHFVRQRLDGVARALSPLYFQYLIIVRFPLCLSVFLTPLTAFLPLASLTSCFQGAGFLTVSASLHSCPPPGPTDLVDRPFFGLSSPFGWLCVVAFLSRVRGVFPSVLYVYHLGFWRPLFLS